MGRVSRRGLGPTVRTEEMAVTVIERTRVSHYGRTILAAHKSPTKLTSSETRIGDWLRVAFGAKVFYHFSRCDCASRTMSRCFTLD